MSGVEQRARELREAIGKYWELAYAEGKEGRTCDTENGDAQATWHRIDRLIAALASQGEKQVGPDAESAARAYERYRDAGATHEQALHAALADALASQAQVQVPEEWRAFVAACADARGGMVNGNNLARQARELLAAAPAPEVR